VTHQVDSQTATVTNSRTPKHGPRPKAFRLAQVFTLLDLTGLALMNRIHELLDGKPDDALALIDFDETHYSYAQLRDMSVDLAFHLADYGLRAGDRLILVAENSAFYAAALFAASRLSAWIILVNARQSAEEIAAICAHSGARCILFTASVSGAARAHAQRLAASHIGDLPAGPILITPLVDAMPEPVDASDAQVATLLYTTGTTSAPKGVMLTHKNLIFNATNSAAFNGLKPDDQVLGVLPGTHIYCLASAFLPVVAVGGSTRFVPRFDPSEVLQYLRQNITRFPGVPQMFAAIIALLDKTGQQLNAPQLRNLATGGAPLDPDLKQRVQQVFGLPLNNGYGLTETSPTVATTHNNSPRSDCSVGAAIPNVTVRVSNANDDGIGELEVGGNNIMKGYYRDPDLTAKVITPDGFFRTGDLGKIDPDGAIHVVGRLKELIIRSGFNVHPPEVEAMLTRHPDVYQAAVIGRSVPGNEEILAFLLTNGCVNETALKSWLRDRLVAYKIPQHIFVVEAFPTAATGKILKHKLTSHFSELLAQRTP
jgi:acyl-CoA synthetase (AMP-forming)/AMP-acid ligase II